jgi:formylglycine-generating enzyme required for sulfatase activity
MKLRSPLPLFFAALIALAAIVLALPPAGTVNSIGMALVRIAPGTFEMGVDSTPLPATLIKGPSGVIYDRPSDAGDYDEVPVHKVTITQAFWMSATEVTVDQYRQFRPAFRGNPYYAPYASGVSWNDAVAFARWLSEKEGKTYRLPTETEWEFACRAGTRTLFSSGAQPPPPEAANPWGLKNMHSGVSEWVLDWHGMYPREAQIDPVGPEYGIAKVAWTTRLPRRMAASACRPRWPTMRARRIALPSLGALSRRNMASGSASFRLRCPRRSRCLTRLRSSKPP